MLGYFDTYVINLPARRDRRKEVGRELQKVGMGWGDVTLFPAVRPEDADGFPTIGTRGCYLSHLGVLRCAGSRPLLILEDDVGVVRDFRARLAGVADYLQSNPWGIFYGGHRVAQEPTHLEPHTADIVTAHMVAFAPDVAPRVAAYLEATMTGANGLGPMHVDGAYNHFRRDNPDVITRLAVPELAYQRSSRSDIHALGWRDTGPLAPITGLLRQFKNSFREQK